MEILLALCAGFVLDLIIGDPLWLPHPVQAIGGLIRLLEKALRRLFPKTAGGQLAAGSIMAALICLAGFGVPAGLLWAAGLLHPWARLGLHAVMAWQVLATKSLRDAALRVLRPLLAGDLAAARAAVAMVVGRDTAALDAAGVARATVETVAENTADGVVAPMLYLALGGAPLAFLYKAVNTMDSMVGYRNHTYLYFGRPAARLDDIANFLPARLAGLLMVAASALCGLSARGAFRVMWRDHQNHLSPNSAWTEAACAGALGVRLGGGSRYGGVLVEKPTIGDDTRPITPADIHLSVRLLYGAATLCLLLCAGVRLAILLALGRGLL